ncbi:mitochondrial protein, putative [Candida dubliniensis CD36]|uniref:Mitochondrial protein, putative n=1 Tax=Candida dubliniensis (strain CD36 / ATCC MYA-646 / CBS 7987 / NCPF 3949 / NRRL Y-17841) TaxID=573826 RepID=B9W736_CANDC|nr:mitochondrial protein, putative [Candida dubliniensis CD36]CAX44494.1 mitochondrial protein, putative [Candida dubliniensis CD36]
MIIRTRPLIQVLPRYNYFYRLNSSKNKFSSIENFNKNKTTYNFGYNFHDLKDLDNKINPQPKESRKDIGTNSKPNDYGNDNDKPIDINALLENDPRLLKLKPGTAEYRDELKKLHQEFESNQKKQRSRHEFNQRIKGMVFGLLALIGIVSTHQLLTNYESIKNRLLSNYNYSDLNEDNINIKSTNKKNVKSTKYMLEKLAKELNDENLNQIQDSKTVSGVYIFGNNDGNDDGNDGCKIPLRIPFFNNMYLKDAYIEKGHLIVINDQGKVYEWNKDWSNVKLINLPFKIEKITPTKDYFYFLTNKGEIVYIPRIKSNSEFIPLQRRNWFGILTTQIYNKLNIKDIKSFSSGDDHLLLLNKSGKVFVVNCSNNPINRGQYGPSYSPFTKENKIPVNQPIDLTLLNNRIIQTENKQGKAVVPRVFNYISSGKYFNIVCDDNGNIWTWGDNSCGQCGDINTTDLKPVPKIVFTKSDFKRVLRNVLPPRIQEEYIHIKKISTGDDSSYVLINYLDKDVLISFGNGINGQLGGGRYMQVCCWPEIVKSLIGLNEFDESLNSVKPIKIKDINVGNKHLFITLDNVGHNKDVYALGENEFGQQGNGKKNKSCKPMKIPKLIEPEDGKDKLQLVKNLNDVNTKRLSLLNEWKISKNVVVDQVIMAGNDASIIYYKKVQK